MPVPHRTPSWQRLEYPRCMCPQDEVDGTLSLEVQTGLPLQCVSGCDVGFSMTVLERVSCIDKGADFAHLDCPCRMSLYQWMAARDAWLQADGDNTKAVRLMQQDPRAAGCKRMDRLVITWGRDFKARGNFEDKACCGRARQLTDTATLHVASIFKAGHSMSDGHKCYTSLGHVFKDNQALQCIVKTANVSKKHLLRKITRIDTVKDNYCQGQCC